MKEEAIIVENIQYESLAALARAYGINKSTIYKRHQRNKKGDELIPFKYRNKNHESREQSNESELSFCVGTLKFKTVSEACRKLNVSRGSYHARKRYGWSDEEALNLVPRIDGRRKAAKKNQSNQQKKKNKKKGTGLKPPFVVCGNEFKTYKELADFAGEPESVIWQRINLSNKTPEEAILMSGKKKSVIVLGKHFDSLKDFAEEHGITPPERIYSLIKKYSLEDIAKKKFLKNKLTVEYNGKLYRNKKELALAHNITPNQLNYRLDTCGLAIEKALNIPSGASVVDAISQYSTFYIAKIFDKHSKKDNYKFGITRHHVEKRLKELRFESEIIYSLSGQDNVLRETEKFLKCTFQPFRNQNLSASDFDGFSEVFSLTKEQLKQAIFIAKFGYSGKLDLKQELPLVP